MASERRHWDPDVDALIGARIRDARKTAGLTLADIGSALGISATMVAHYETGHIAVRASTLRAIAAAIGVLPGDLIEEDRLALPVGPIGEQRAMSMIVARLARVRDPDALRWVLTIIDFVGEALTRA